MTISFDLIDPRRTAIVVIDMQHNFCSTESYPVKQWNHDVSHLDNIVEKIKDFIKKAESYEVTVIYTKLTYDKDKMSSSLKKKLGSAVGEFAAPNSKGVEFYKINPPESKVFTKYGFDAFQNKEFLTYLKEKNIENLIFIGFDSVVCVESTARTAIELGFSSIILEDLIGEPTFLAEHRKASLFTFNLLFGYVHRSEEILKYWQETSETLKKIKELESQLSKLYSQLK